MALSGTVAFRPDVEEIIAEAFERCGIDPQTQTGYKAVSARRSLNLLFSEWANRGINYWAGAKNPDVGKRPDNAVHASCWHHRHYGRRH